MKFIERFFFGICTVCRPNQSRTVRYAFPVMLAAITYLGAQALLSTNTSYISVEPSTNSVRAGETFHLSVYVSAHVPINAVDLEIAFPRDQVKILGVDKGESVITLWTEEPHVKNNVVYLRGGTFRRGFLGEHLIATVNAQAVETGIAEIKVTDFLLLAGDGSGTEVPIGKNSETATKVYVANRDGSFAPGMEPKPGTIAARVEISINTDIDGDGDVSLADVSRFMSSWFTRDHIYDFNGDGNMTFRDFGIILSDSFFK